MSACAKESPSIWHNPDTVIKQITCTLSSARREVHNLLLRLKMAGKLFGIFAFAFLASTISATACSPALLPASTAQAVPTRNLDQNLFNQAVLVEVNYERCKAGLQPVSLAGGLMLVANTHANWMARRQLLSHRSTVRGQETVQDRVLSSGVNARRGSENIGNTPRYQFSGSRRIMVKNMGRCDFTTPGGRQITPHSYATLATQIVSMWMDSAGHRRNVLDRNAKTIGSAVRFDPKSSHCGQFFLSQNFAG